MECRSYEDRGGRWLSASWWEKPREKPTLPKHLELEFPASRIWEKKKCYWLSPPVCGTLLQRPSKLTGLTDWTFDNCQFTTVHQNYLSHCILIFRLTNFFKSPWKFLFLCPNVLCSRTRKDQTGVESWNCRETVLPVTFESLKFLTL